MNMKLSSMQSDFTKRLESITKQSQETDRATKKLIKDAETKQASANQQLLDAFEASQKRTDDAIKLVSKLRVTLTEQDTRDKAIQKMFLSMYTAMAAKHKVPQVSDDVLTPNTSMATNLNKQSKLPKAAPKPPVMLHQIRCHLRTQL
jgi:hypothetical protein